MIYFIEREREREEERERVQYIRDLMFCVFIETYLSLSGLLCSCHRPRAWKISCMTTPFVVHVGPIEMFCRPPLRPTEEEQLKKEREKLN